MLSLKERIELLENDLKQNPLGFIMSSDLPFALFRCHENAAPPISRLAKSTRLAPAQSRERPARSSAPAGWSGKLGMSGRLRL